MTIYQQRSPDEAYLAFVELYNRYSKKVFSILLTKANNRADAEDLLQKVFIKMHESKHLYMAKYKFEQWIFTIAKTTAIDHFRTQKRREQNMQKIIVETTDDSVVEVLEINPDHLELLEMKYVDELSYQEISKILNKSEVSLRKLVSRITSSLKMGRV